MDNAEHMQSVPYIVHESEVSRLERINKRLFILVVSLIVLLAATNGTWIWYESQFEDEVVTVQQENTDGDNHYNYIGNDGDIINGKADSNDKTENP